MKDCDKCKRSGKSKEHLFLHHMLPILKHINTRTNSAVSPIIWDDMLRKWTVKDMKQLSGLTEIMVWGYVPELEGYPLFTTDMWDKYSQAFKSIWIASSFKGALAANNNLVPISIHLQNHQSWLRVAKKFKNKITGIAITGWSRYDHFATLCELLPAAIPSLALSFSVLVEGSLKPRSKEVIEYKLGFSNPIIVNKDIFGSWDTTIPAFPGGDIYSLVAELENHVSWYTSTKTRYESWGNERQVKQKFVSKLQVKGIGDTLKQLVPSFKSFRKKCLEVMKEYFFDTTIEEWVRDKVDHYITLSEELENQFKIALDKI